MSLNGTAHQLVNQSSHQTTSSSQQQRNASMELAKDFVRHLVHSKSERVSLVLSDTMRSAVWTCFYKIFVDGYQTSFVVCRNCGHILKYTPKDGTTAMRIHMGKFCGRMKAKAINGAPQTPLVPTATASGQNGALTRLTPTPNGNISNSSNNVDEPLDLQKPQVKPILGHGNTSANLSQLSNAIADSPLTAAASAIAAAAAAISGNQSSGSAFALGGRSALHAPLALRQQQMTPTTKAQEILSAFNPIQQTSLTAAAASAPTSSPPQPCDLVVRKPSTSESNSGRVPSDGIEAVAVAFKAALATFDDDLRELDTKINETEATLEKLKSKRLNLISSRDHVNKAARVVLSSVNDNSDSYEPHPVDAMINWVRRNSNGEVNLKRSHDSPLSNWPNDLQHQFSRGPKRLRKSQSQVRRNPTSNGALGNASELLNGVVPDSPAKLPPSSGSVLSGENNGGQVTTSSSSSIAQTPPTSDDQHEENDEFKAEPLDDVDVEDVDSLTDSSVKTAPNSLDFVEKVDFREELNTANVTAVGSTPSYLFAATSDGRILRSDLHNKIDSFEIFDTNLADEQQQQQDSITCMSTWIFGQNHDDFAVVVGSRRGLVRVYNPDFSNILCEKKLNWPVTSLRVAAKRHIAFVGLKMGIVLALDLDKMELASKTVCGFGPIVDIDIVGDCILVAAEDGSVTLRDFSGQVVSSVDLTSLSPIQGIKAAATANGDIFAVAATSQRGLVASALEGDKTVVEVSCEPRSIFGSISPGFVYSIDSDSKVVASRLGHGQCEDLWTQQVDEECCVSEFVHSSVFNEDSLLFASRNGLAKIFRINNSSTFPRPTAIH